MDPHAILLTAGRAAAVYFFVLFVVRVLGKREVGSSTAFDLLATLMLGEVVDEIIYGDVSVLQGFVAIGAIGALHYLNSWGSFYSKWIDRLTGASPTVLVRDGRVQEKALAEERMSREELESQLRLQSVEDLSEIKRATLEPNGQLSVLKQEWAREATVRDLSRAEQKVGV